MRWTCDRCLKINKSPAVSNGVRASSFEIWTANLAQSLTVGTQTNSRSFIFGDSNWKFCSRLPRRPPKTWHSDADISDFGFNFFLKIDALFFNENKNQNQLDIHKLGKIWSELKLFFCVCVFIIDISSSIQGSFDTVTSLRKGFHSERAAAGLGPSGLRLKTDALINSCLWLLFLVLLLSSSPPATQAQINLLPWDPLFLWGPSLTQRDVSSRPWRWTPASWSISSPQAEDACEQSRCEHQGECLTAVKQIQYHTKQLYYS